METPEEVLEIFTKWLNRVMQNKPRQKYLGRFYLVISLLLGLAIFPQNLKLDELGMLLNINSTEILSAIA